MASTRDIALTATMAALIVVLSRLPGFPVIGVDGAQIGIVSCVVPVFGFLLGPWLGGSAALFGGIASRALFGASPFNWFALPAMALSAFTAGCLSRRKVGFIKGWVSGAFIMGGLITSWYLTSIGQSVLVYPILHWTALAAILIFRGWLAYFIQYGKEGEFVVCVCLAGFAATMVAHLYGTLAFLLAVELGVIGVQLNSLFFFGLIPVIAVERLVITSIITILGVPILLALRSRFFRS